MLSLHTLLHDLIIIYDPATTETYTLSLHDALPIYQRAGGAGGAGRREGRRHAGRPLAPQGDRGARPPGQRGGLTSGNPGWRSEEHTSELQSRENLVCRLLLEKKKKNNIRNATITNQ